MLVSLLSVAVVGDWEYVGLGIALLGGIAVGVAAAQESSAGKGQSRPRPGLSVPQESGAPSMPRRLERLFAWLVDNELWLLLIVSPLFLFPRPISALGFLLVPVLWILRWWLRGCLTERTPLDWPILLIAVMLIVAMLASADWAASLPKLAGLTLGIGVYYAIVNRSPSEQQFRWMTVALSILGLGIGVVGLLGTGGLNSKFLPIQITALTRTLDPFPKLAPELINPNEVGGALAWIVPILAVLTLAQWRDRVETLPRLFKFRWWSLLSSYWSIIALVFASIILLLTQSRSALFGVVVSLGIFSAVRWHRLRLLFVALLIGIGIAGLVFGFQPFLQTVFGSGGSGGATGTLDFASRQEVWERALYAIQDFPLTGLGLNMFDPVTKVLYPYFLISPDTTLIHAHDIYLQVAVDLGLPGLVAYIALLSAFAYMVYKLAITGASAYTRTVALALGLGVLAHQIFGLTDAITLGAKPGILFWIILGLAGGLWLLEHPRPKPLGEQSGQQVS